nr:hypothetical protein CPGR_01574 [Mycolicibacterium malmesburyense]
MIGASVRTIGTKRAMTIANGPRCSKKTCASSRYFCLRNRAFGLNIAVPMLRPIQYPTWPPRTAAMGMNTSNCHSWKLMTSPPPSASAAVPAANMPATNSSESPGRTGNSTPDSTKITTSSPTSAHVPK